MCVFVAAEAFVCTFSFVYMCGFMYEHNVSVSLNQEPWTFWKGPQSCLCV